MIFRADIQSLRGLAVLLVVLFHLGLSGLQSGFLGVDVFFVVSGFLMAVLYDKDQKLDFFTRRAKRLVPAYFVTVAVTLFAAFILTTPNEFNQVVEQTWFASIFSSNIGFWLQSSYFSKAEFNPLLHLWSLGVEIQFYLALPIIAWFIRRHAVFFVAITLVSFLLCIKILEISPKTSFFMMPLRLWEFMIGYGVARYLTLNGAKRFDNLKWLGLVGFIGIILVPFMPVDGDAENIVTGHPALFALFVSLATAAVLAFGLPDKLENSKPFSVLVVLGNYSYSIYLAHFPLIVLYLASPFSGTVLGVTSVFDAVVLVIGIALLSLLLHHLVEKRRYPFKGFIPILVPAFLLVLSSVVLQRTQLNSLSTKEQYIFSAFSDRSAFRCGKLIRIIHPTAISCLVSKDIDNASQRILLVGNSHADSIKSAFSKAAEKGNSITYFFVQNSALTSSGLSPKEIIEEAKQLDITSIVLHYSPNAINIERVKELATLAEAAAISVVLIEPVPVWQEHIPKAMYQHYVNNDELPEQSIADYQKRNKLWLDQLDTIQEPGFKRYSVSEIFCAPMCAISSPEGVPYYFDHGHLTLTGSNVLNQLFSELVGDL